MESSVSGSKAGADGIARHPSTRKARLAAAAWWLALAAICLNALLFAVKAANPLVVADGWHFLEAIVMPYAHGDLAFGDLFLKRSAMDHSQPLRKLILLMHYEWFDLDYAVEAVIGHAPTARTMRFLPSVSVPLDAAAAPVLDALLHVPPVAMAESKASILRYAGLYHTADEIEAMALPHGLKRLSAEADEGLASFLEKREPSWWPGPAEGE